MTTCGWLEEHEVSNLGDARPLSHLGAIKWRVLHSQNADCIWIWVAVVHFPCRWLSLKRLDNLHACKFCSSLALGDSVKWGVLAHEQIVA